jgi:hypothetical protein
VMLLVAAGIPSVGLAQCVLGVTVAPTYYANATNDWANQLHPLLPAWLRLVDEGAIRAYFNGARGEGGVPWRLWLAPLAAWSLFALLLYTAFFCLSLLLRRAWIYQERLAFPLVQVPLELVGRERVPMGNATFFRNPLALLGMAVPALFHTLNSFHNLSPSIPAGFTSPIPIGELLVDRPWSALSDARIFVYFSVIGLSYLLAGEVSLSLWFFHMLSRAQLVLFSAMGFDERGGAEAVGFSPSWFVTNQMWGALFGFGAFLVWDGLRAALAGSGGFTPVGGRAPNSGGSTPGYRSGALPGRTAPEGQRRLAGGNTPGLGNTHPLLSPRSDHGLGGRNDPGGATRSELRAAFIGLCVSLLLMAFWLTAAGGRFPIQLLGLLLWVAAMLSLARLVADVPSGSQEPSRVPRTHLCCPRRPGRPRPARCARHRSPFIRTRCAARSTCSARSTSWSCPTCCSASLPTGSGVNWRAPSKPSVVTATTRWLPGEVGNGRLPARGGHENHLPGAPAAPQAEEEYMSQDTQTIAIEVIRMDGGTPTPERITTTPRSRLRVRRRALIAPRPRRSPPG